jgi:hypothetical protein
MQWVFLTQTAKCQRQKKRWWLCKTQSSPSKTISRAIGFIIIWKVQKHRIDNAGSAPCLASTYFKLSPKIKHEFWSRTLDLIAADIVNTFAKI